LLRLFTSYSPNLFSPLSTTSFPSISAPQSKKIMPPKLSLYASLLGSTDPKPDDPPAEQEVTVKKPLNAGT
jgi:hypothetical protein